jgi:hypothetical protein
MKLVYESTGVEVKTGDVVHVRGVPYFVMETREPHKPSSTGRVFCKAMNDQGWVNEWFPGVIGADWIERDDR